MFLSVRNVPKQQLMVFNNNVISITNEYNAMNK